MTKSDTDTNTNKKLKEFYHNRINRAELYAWINGEVMIRNNEGNVFIVDESKCEQLEKRMLVGESVYLTGSDNKVISVVNLENETFVERCITEFAELIAQENE